MGASFVKLALDDYVPIRPILHPLNPVNGELTAGDGPRGRPLDRCPRGGHRGRATFEFSERVGHFGYACAVGAYSERRKLKLGSPGRSVPLTGLGQRWRWWLAVAVLLAVALLVLVLLVLLEALVVLVLGYTRQRLC